jgi:hypothetical protein
MGRTIPSYRIASEIEILKWRPFRKLLDKQDRKKFDEMLSIPHLYTVAGTMAARPVLIHVILMSRYEKCSEELRSDCDSIVSGYCKKAPAFMCADVLRDVIRESE